MSDEKLYCEISNKIKKLIVSGQYPMNSIIPSIRKLQNDFGVSKNTLQSSLKLLTEEGIIHREGSTRQGYRIIKKPAQFETDFPEKHDYIKLILPFNHWNYLGNMLFEACENVFAKNDISILFGNNKNSVSEEKLLLERVLSANLNLLQALILVTGSSFSNPNTDLIKSIQKKIPVILVDRYINGLNCHYIGINNKDIGYNLTVYLLEKGHSKIGFVSGNKNFSPIYERFLGYKMALEFANIPFNEKHMTFEPDTHGSLDSIENFGRSTGKRILSLSDLPTAIVCGSDKVAVGLYKFFTGEGLSIPGDMSLVGCDNDLGFAAHIPIKLTTVQYPFDNMAEEVFKLFCELKQNPGLPRKSIELDSILIEGESTSSI